MHLCRIRICMLLHAVSMQSTTRDGGWGNWFRHILSLLQVWQGPFSDNCSLCWILHFLVLPISPMLLFMPGTCLPAIHLLTTGVCFQAHQTWASRFFDLGALQGKFWNPKKRCNWASSQRFVGKNYYWVGISSFRGLRTKEKGHSFCRPFSDPSPHLTP